MSTPTFGGLRSLRNFFLRVSGISLPDFRINVFQNPQPFNARPLVFEPERWARRADLDALAATNPFGPAANTALLSADGLHGLVFVEWYFPDQPFPCTPGSSDGGFYLALAFAQISSPFVSIETYPGEDKDFALEVAKHYDELRYIARFGRSRVSIGQRWLFFRRNPSYRFGELQPAA